ncbi:MAG: MauE/DoxX family redox-associated membrane protein [Actinomycetota bacterium]
MPEVIVRTAAGVLAATLGVAGLLKLARPAAWRVALRGYDLPRGIERGALLGVPAAELGAAGLILFAPPRAGAAFALALFAVFSLAVVHAQARHGPRLPCGCFGGNKTRDFRTILVRNTALAALAAIVLLGHTEGAAWPDEAVPLGLTLAGIGLGVWMIRGASVMWQKRERT